MTKHHIQTLVAIMFLAVVAACGAGTSHAPGSVVPTGTSNSTGSTGSGSGVAVPAATYTLPPGTVGVTLSITIPKAYAASIKAHAAPVSIKRSATSATRSPAFIQSQTTGVQAVVSPASGPQITVPAVTCSSSPCSITIPIPLAVNSSVVVQLIENTTVIGQASASFTAGQFAEGVVNTPVSLTFQPIIASVIVAFSPVNSGTTFLQGYNQSFGAQLILQDPASNDVGPETSGVLDTNGNPFTTVNISSNNVYGGASPIPTQVNVGAGYPASDNVLLSTITYNGYSQAQPDIIPSGSATTSYIALSQNSLYTYIMHGFTATSPGGSPWNGGTIGEYLTPSLLQSQQSQYGGDTFTVTENIPADSSTATIFLDFQGNTSNYSSQCLSNPGIVNGANFSYNYSAGAYTETIPMSNGYGTFTLPYSQNASSGTCLFEIADGSNVVGGLYPNNFTDFTLYLDNPTIYVQRKKRK